MRDIKFRIWDKESKKIRKVNSLHLETDQEGEWCVECYGKSYVTNEGDHDAAIDVIRGHNFELMQFTGLHDKNGKEIWEGDIYTISSKTLGEVFFETMYARWSIQTNGGQYDLVGSEKDWSQSIEPIQLVGEVIGNVYENKELLE